MLARETQVQGHSHLQGPDFTLLPTCVLMPNPKRKAKVGKQSYGSIPIILRGKEQGREGACRGWGTVPSSTTQSQSPAACSRGSIPWAVGPSFVGSSFSVPNTDLRKQCYMPAMSGRTERGKAGAAHRWEDTVGRLKCERGQTSLPLHANAC